MSMIGDDAIRQSGLLDDDRDARRLVCAAVADFVQGFIAHKFQPPHSSDGGHFLLLSSRIAFNAAGLPAQ
jgi:hypothetical protein